MIGAAGVVGAGAAAPALVRLTRKAPRRLAGGFVDDGSARGHALRDRGAAPAVRRTERVAVAIVGGGIAGLTAAWQLDRRGMSDYVVIELADEAGGNARGGENAVTRYPWAAHYLPVPGRDSTLVRELLADLGVLGADGRWDERALCFSPQERLFLHGEWHAGLEPEFALAPWERGEFVRFAELVGELRQTGAFTIPSAVGLAGPGAGAVARLDARSAAAWLADEGFRSPALRWYVEYGCRDDYGAPLGDTSAWAAAHYFAARDPDEPGPLTWPEGNAWLARRLAARVGQRLRTGAAVRRVESLGGRRGVRVLAGDTAYLADAVVFAAPTFLAPHVVANAPPAPAFVYSPWLTANLTVERPPAGRGAPPAWDNVLYASPALGYVIATHQSLVTAEGASVWTYYWALTEQAPAAARQLLAHRPWGDWAELILADLERAHPDLRDCVSRVDVLRMGHAMARPTRGFLTDPARRRYAEAGGPLFYAHSDLSGLSLFEEAQQLGVRAAERVVAYVGGTTA